MTKRIADGLGVSQKVLAIIAAALGLTLTIGSFGGVMAGMRQTVSITETQVRQHDLSIDELSTKVNALDYEARAAREARVAQDAKLAEMAKSLERIALGTERLDERVRNQQESIQRIERAVNAPH
jgi:outer membrane murein-binding lipoprotein Lpp